MPAIEAADGFDPGELVFPETDEARDSVTSRALAQARRSAPRTEAPPRRTPGRPLRTWQDAEDFAEHWMRNNGYPDAHKTPPGADGGIDVTSARRLLR
ncbi:hypothetical protein EV641_106167 [Rhodococcus sp. SMB37]|uniref:hypothetical protein n=1 Tax=Rhodococcus sp. SMB37 TaxID=2512213 RepID=UPI0010EA8BD3|nr:hypothetical protein [Rhodococcus sp. SMB37]TCN53521.1 hypothetical protein EV641_106167 [Rhodococcus sp. SMB37]